MQQGATRATVPPGSVTLVPRCGGSIKVPLHCHGGFLEGVFVDRTAQGLQPRFLPADPPTDADIATALQTISRRVIRALRMLGYLEADTQAVVPTGDDPLASDAPELARTLAASVQQRLACGERAGQQVRRIGSGCGYAGERSILMGTRCASVNGLSLPANPHVPAHRRDPRERLLRYTARGAVALERLDVHADGDLLCTFTPPWSDGTTGITRSLREWLEKRAALVPLPRLHPGRDGGCVAPQSHLRAAIIPTLRQQGADEPAGSPVSPHWTWARWRQRVLAMDRARGPVCQQGRLRSIAALTAGHVIQNSLRPLQRAVDPPSLAPARHAAFVVGRLPPVTCAPGRRASAARPAPARRAPARRRWAPRPRCAAATPAGRRCRSPRARGPVAPSPQTQRVPSGRCACAKAFGAAPAPWRPAAAPQGRAARGRRAGGWGAAAAARGGKGALELLSAPSFVSLSR